MKKRIVGLFAVIMLCLTTGFGLFGCGEAPPPDAGYPEGDPMYLTDRELVAYEAERSFDFLWEQTQTAAGPAYGLVRDRYPGSPGMASTASVGFALAAIPAAVENGWIERAAALKRVEGTFRTIAGLENEHGFNYHFINMSTGKHMSGSEISVIDTAIMLAGVITAGEYFGGELKTAADDLYAAVDWKWYTGKNGSKTQFRMGYDPVKGEFAGWWDYYAEQLVMYVLGAGAANAEFRIDKQMFYDFSRMKGRWGGKGEEFIFSWFGALFTYQFSHCFVDFRNTRDEDGVNWYENSVNATLAARQYCIDRADEYSTYGENSWGLTACDKKNGYGGSLGAQPSGLRNEAVQSDGTIAPSGAVGSMPFAPEQCTAALRHYYSDTRLRTGKYGLRDAYNLDQDWYAPDVVGINKGVTVLMSVNYLNDGIVWKYFMQNENIRAAMERLGISETAEQAAA